MGINWGKIYKAWGRADNSLTAIHSNIPVMFEITYFPFLRVCGRKKFWELLNINPQVLCASFGRLLYSLLD